MAHPIDEAIGRSIRMHRRAAQMTQSDLGQRAGIRAQQLHRFETALNRVSAAQLWRIACSLEIDIVALFEGAPHSAKPSRSLVAGAQTPGVDQPKM